MLRLVRKGSGVFLTTLVGLLWTGLADRRGATATRSAKPYSSRLPVYFQKLGRPRIGSGRVAHMNSFTFLGRFYILSFPGVLLDTHDIVQ